MEREKKGGSGRMGSSLLKARHHRSERITSSDTSSESEPSSDESSSSESSSSSLLGAIDLASAFFEDSGFRPKIFPPIDFSFSLAFPESKF